MSSARRALKKRPMIPLLLTVFIDMLGLGIAIPVLAVIFLDPSISVLPADTPLSTRAMVYGFLLASYPLAQFFGAPILGALSDRYGRKPVLLIPLAGMMLGYVLFAVGIVTRNVPLLFMSRALDGFAGGSISIVLSAIADISDGPRKTRNFGFVGMAFGLGFILGPFFGGKLADSAILPWFSLSTPFLFAALLTGINILLCLTLFQETYHERVRTPLSLTTGFRNLAKAFTLPRLRTIFIVTFLLTLGFNFFVQFFQVFLIDKFRFTHTDIGDFFAYVGICIALAQGVVTPFVARRYSARAMLGGSSLLLGLGIPLLLLPERTWGLYVLVPVIAVFQGLTQPSATTLVSDLSDKESQGEIMGINQSIQSLAMAIPPIVAGFITGIHITLPVFAASAATLLAWGVFVAFFRTKPTSTSGTMREMDRMIGQVLRELSKR